MFVDVVRLVGGGEHFALVNIIDAQRLQDLRLDEMADARLGHDGNADRFDDTLDHIRVRHASDTTLHTDIGRHALQGHHRAGASVFGDLGVLRRDHIHDDAALEHLRQATLDGDAARALFCPVLPCHGCYLP